MAAPKRSKKEKSHQSTIANDKTVNPHNQNDWFYYYKFYNQGCVSLSALERLADKIIQVVYNNPRVMTFKEALRQCSTNEYSMVAFLKRSEKLRHAKKMAMCMLGSKRETGALFRDLDPGIFKHMQGKYDSDWEEQEQYFNKLKQDIADKTNTNNDKVPVLISVSEFERLSDALIEDQRRRADTAKEVHAPVVSDPDSKSS